MVKSTKQRRPEKGLQIRRVKSKEDRKRPSVWLRLKEKEQFRGIALFEPDPEMEKNPGYYEYYDHYDRNGNTYVPCSGDKCPFCAANDNPSTRALTVWYMPDADVKDQIKVFTMNYGTLNDLADEAEEEGGIIGKKIRVKRMDDRGAYRVKILSDKKITAKELKAALALLDERFPKGLEGEVLRQLKIQMERLSALDALDDDDDDDDEDEEETTTKKKRGKAVEPDEDDDDDDDDDDEDDDDDDEDDESDSSDDDDEDDDDSDDDEDSDDDDDDEDDDDDDSDDDDDEEERPSFEGESFEVTKTNEDEEVFTVKKSKVGEYSITKLFVGEGVKVNWDKAGKGSTITVDAIQDDEGDWIISKLSAKAAKADKPADKKKGGKKKK